MGLLAATFGTATVALVVASSILGRRHPAFQMALLLMACWAIANLTDPWVDPWLDAMAFYAVLLTWFRHKRRWLIAMGAAFFAQLIVHMAFQEHSPWFRMLTLNILYSVEWLCIFTGTAGDLFALKRHRDRRDHSGDYGLRPSAARKTSRRSTPEG